ncbi:MAG: ABC transporter substrate-binding protein [Streptosporangiaceae bacterium]
MARRTASGLARTRSRKTIIFIAAAAAGALSLAACGGSSAPSASSSSTAGIGSTTSGTIVWSASPIAGAGATDTRTVLINAFEKAYPKIKVNLVSASTDTDTNRATLATTISGGSSTPDVFMGDVIWPAQFGAHQLAVPLSNYLPASYFAKFAPGLIQGATYKGKVYGSPLFEDQGFLYYRKDLLAKYHMSVPTTWEQLESDAKTIQAKNGIKYGFVWEGDSYEGLTCNFMEYLTDAGGTATNSGYTKASLNSPAAVKAVTFMRSLITSGVTPAAVTTFQEPQAMDTFAAGQSVFLRNWDYAYSYATTPATSKLTKSQVGVAPLPTFQGQSYPGYSNIGGWNMYINPHSKHIGLDLTFIKWLASPAAQDILAMQYSEIPTIESVRTSASVIASNAVLAIVPKTRLVPRPAGTPNYPALSTAIYTNVNAILAGSVSPSAGLANAQSQANTALASTSSGGL